MLLLVLPDGNIVRLIQQDVCRHQSGIGKETAVDVLGVFGAFVLELGHTAEFAEHGVAVEDPAEFGVFMNMALDEEGVLLRVQAARDILR